jgi:apolipoprotein N-acyltransferase
MGYMRGIENGFATIEQTGSGLSVSFDYKGNVLSKMDNNAAGDEAVMISHTPTKGSTTFYGMVGDVFAWLAILSLVILLGLSRKWEIRVENETYKNVNMN